MTELCCCCNWRLANPMNGKTGVLCNECAVHWWVHREEG